MRNRLEAYFAARSAAAAVADGPDSLARVRVTASAGVTFQSEPRLFIAESDSVVILSRKEAEQWARAGAVEILD